MNADKCAELLPEKHTHKGKYPIEINTVTNTVCVTSNNIGHALLKGEQGLLNGRQTWRNSRYKLNKGGDRTLGDDAGCSEVDNLDLVLRLVEQAAGGVELGAGGLLKNKSGSIFER